jgi:predicted DNA-binding antitoxin AbrB/MazE fold protein
MNQLITATFDGQVLKPEIPLNLEVNKKYQIQLVFHDDKDSTQEHKENSQELKELHQEFDWLIADIGVNRPLTRKTAYES